MIVKSFLFSILMSNIIMILMNRSGLVYSPVLRTVRISIE